MSRRSDTRRARAIPAVRRLATAALLAGTVSWPALLGAADAVIHRTGMVLPGSLWAGLGIAAAAAVVARVAAAVRVALRAAGLTAVACALATGVGGEPVLPVVLLVGIVATAWLLGGILGLSASVVPTGLRSAALGWTAAAAAAGTLPAIHVAAVAGDSVTSAGWWLTAYASGALALVHLALGSAPRDRRHAVERDAPHPADGTLVRLEAVDVVLDGVPVVRSVDLAVDAGEVCVVCGTNGAGKTTLLRTIAGFVHPVGGSVRFDGEDVSGLAPEDLAGLGVLYVDGSRPVFGDLTVLENLRIGAYLTHRSRAAFEEATLHVFRLFGELAARRDEPAGTLSGGEQRLLALAQTLYARPRVLLLDELTTGLAPEPLRRLLGAVHALAREGTAVVVVEHDLPTAAALGGRVVFLDAGAVRFAGTGAELAARGDLLRPVFLGGPR